MSSFINLRIIKDKKKEDKFPHVSQRRMVYVKELSYLCFAEISHA